jgi:class 3 adenylate cyclase
MTPLQTTVLMKTDIAGSTPRFRALLAADLQELILEHREFIAQHAAVEGGEIVRLEGDGYWLKFPSVTGAAKSAIAMQEALRLTQTNKGDDRLSIRIAIGLGDIAFQENDLIGDMLALVVRIEAITPADEIYLTSAARLALTSSEVQTTLVDNFVLKGFVEPVPVYSVEQRHRTRIIDDAYILVSDLRGFTRLTETQPVVAIERVLDALDALAHRIAHEFDGTIRFSFGDSYCLTFSNVAQLVAAAERLSQDWEATGREARSACAINLALHRGKISVFRSFLYGQGYRVAAHVAGASTEVLAVDEGSIFVTSAVRDDLSDGAWHNRLQPVALTQRDAHFAGLEVYRLSSPSGL